MLWVRQCALSCSSFSRHSLRVFSGRTGHDGCNNNSNNNSNSNNSSDSNSGKKHSDSEEWWQPVKVPPRVPRMRHYGMMRPEDEVQGFMRRVYLWPPVFLRDRVEAQQVVRKLDLSLHSTRDLPFVSELALLKGSRWQYNDNTSALGAMGQVQATEPVTGKVFMHPGLEDAYEAGHMALPLRMYDAGLATAVKFPTTVRPPEQFLKEPYLWTWNSECFDKLFYQNVFGMAEKTEPISLWDITAYFSMGFFRLYQMLQDLFGVWISHDTPNIQLPPQPFYRYDATKEQMIDACRKVGELGKRLEKHLQLLRQGGLEDHPDVQFHDKWMRDLMFRERQNYDPNSFEELGQMLRYFTLSMNEKEDMTNWGHRRRPVYFFQDRWLDRVEMDCPRAQPWEIPLSVDKLVLKLEDEDIIRQKQPSDDPEIHAIEFPCQVPSKQHSDSAVPPAVEPGRMTVDDTGYWKPVPGTWVSEEIFSTERLRRETVNALLLETFFNSPYGYQQLEEAMSTQEKKLELLLQKVQPVETVAMRPVSPVQPPKSLVGRHRAFVDDTAPDPFVSQGPSRETTRRARRIGHDISQ